MITLNSTAFLVYIKFLPNTKLDGLNKDAKSNLYLLNINNFVSIDMTSFRQARAYSRPLLKIIKN